MNLDTWDSLVMLLLNGFSAKRAPKFCKFIIICVMFHPGKLNCEDHFLIEWWKRNKRKYAKKNQTQNNSMKTKQSQNSMLAF